MSRKPPAEGAAPADPPVTPQDPPPAAEAAPEPDSADEAATTSEPEAVADPEASRADAPELEPEPEPEPPVPTAARVDRSEIEFLGTLSVNRLGLYRFPGLGFGAGQRGPFYPDDFVEAVVAKGFAFHEPTGGSHGSVKITDAGRAAYRALRQAEPLPQAV